MTNISPPLRSSPGEGEERWAFNPFRNEINILWIEKCEDLPGGANLISYFTNVVVTKL